MAGSKPVALRYMTKLFFTDNKTLERKIKQTVRAYGIYSFQGSGSGCENNIFIQSRGIVLQYKILSIGNKSKLYISAMSPFCTITRAYQDIWMNRFFNDLETLPKSQSILSFAFQKMAALINFFACPPLKF